jgi:hypothetical protein
LGVSSNFLYHLPSHHRKESLKIPPRESEAVIQGTERKYPVYDVRTNVKETEVPIIKVVNHYCEGKWKEFKDSWTKELVDTHIFTVHIIK